LRREYIRRGLFIKYEDYLREMLADIGIACQRQAVVTEGEENGDK